MKLTNNFAGPYDNANIGLYFNILASIPGKNSIGNSVPNTSKNLEYNQYNGDESSITNDINPIDIQKKAFIIIAMIALAISTNIESIFNEGISPINKNPNNKPYIINNTSLVDISPRYDDNINFI